MHSRRSLLEPVGEATCVCHISKLRAVQTLSPWVTLYTHITGTGQPSRGNCKLIHCRKMCNVEANRRDSKQSTSKPRAQTCISDISIRTTKFDVEDKMLLKGESAAKLSRFNSRHRVTHSTLSTSLTSPTEALPHVSGELQCWPIGVPRLVAPEEEPRPRPPLEAGRGAVPAFRRVAAKRLPRATADAVSASRLPRATAAAASDAARARAADSQLLRRLAAVRADRAMQGSAGACRSSCGSRPHLSNKAHRTKHHSFLRKHHHRQASRPPSRTQPQPSYNASSRETRNKILCLKWLEAKMTYET